MTRSTIDRLYRQPLLFSMLGILIFLPVFARANDEIEPVPDTVVLLHGLARSNQSMEKLEAALDSAGYRVVNIDYPSTAKSIEEHANDLARQVEATCSEAPNLHFITHSLGGIIVRFYLSGAQPGNLGRVVMLSPPNSGSTLVDLLGDNKLFKAGMGPAAQQLGTAPDDFPNTLGPVDFDLGVITGDQSINPLFSWLIPGEDDGQVAVDSTRVSGMADFLVLPENHTFIMRSEDTIRQALYFLANGRFDRSDEQEPS